MTAPSAMPVPSRHLQPRLIYTFTICPFSSKRKQLRSQQQRKPSPAAAQPPLLMQAPPARRYP
jgi:hypothetical protein